ncbi:MAG: hypothetical protein AB7S26_23520 [Sandaracinaceae bacterium]
MDAHALDRAAWNATRYRPGRGFYESWFLRANHPSRPLGFWIRYTIFEADGRAGAAEGELWAVYFDGERDTVVATKREISTERCAFSPSELDVRIDEARLDERALEGEIPTADHRIAWRMRYDVGEPPLLFLDRPLYGTALPRAKALVSAPNARFDGTLGVDGATIMVDGWIGSQNHNWGTRQTDRYAWCQVAGFDDAPDAFLEVSCARLALGPVQTPPMTVLALRLDGEEHRLSTSIPRALRAHGRYEPFHFAFAAERGGVSVSGTVAASPEAFVALPYRNPPGGTKVCLNSKIARCDLSVRRNGGPPRVLVAKHRAAFEILTDERPLGVPWLEVEGGVGSVARGPA